MYNLLFKKATMHSNHTFNSKTFLYKYSYFFSLKKTVLSINILFNFCRLGIQGILTSYILQVIETSNWRLSVHILSCCFQISQLIKSHWVFFMLKAIIRWLSIVMFEGPITAIKLTNWLSVVRFKQELEKLLKFKDLVKRNAQWHSYLRLKGQNRTLSTETFISWAHWGRASCPWRSMKNGGRNMAMYVLTIYFRLLSMSAEAWFDL